jgi:formamidopyrimidine-DNA glycosylase
MPELAETYLAVKYLDDNMPKGLVRHVEVKHKRAENLKFLEGKRILKVRQKGKYQIFFLESAGKYPKSPVLIAHMRFTGMWHFEGLPKHQKWGLEGTDSPYTDNTIRAVIHFDDSSILYFYDRRALALFYSAINTTRLERHGRESICGHDLLTKQGQDWILTPYSVEQGFFSEPFWDDEKGNIKEVMLSQEKIKAGVGNYVACEALYRSGIHPLKKVPELTYDEWQHLSKMIIEVIQAAMDNDADYAQGFIKVFRKKVCPLGHQIQRYKQSGSKFYDNPLKKARSTYYCPTCQPGDDTVTEYPANELK